LKIHFSDSDFECSIRATTLFKKTALERFRTATNLWDIEIELAEGGLKSAIFKTVSLAITVFSTLVSSNL